MVETNFEVWQMLETSNGEITYYSLDKLSQYGYAQLSRLPFSIRILLENTLRTGNSAVVPSLAGWSDQ